MLPPVSETQGLRERRRRSGATVQSRDVRSEPGGKAACQPGDGAIATLGMARVGRKPPGSEPRSIEPRQPYLLAQLPARARDAQNRTRTPRALETREQGAEPAGIGEGNAPEVEPETPDSAPKLRRHGPLQNSHRLTDGERASQRDREDLRRPPESCPRHHQLHWDLPDADSLRPRLPSLYGVRCPTVPFGRNRSVKSSWKGIAPVASVEPGLSGGAPRTPLSASRRTRSGGSRARISAGRRASGRSGESPGPPGTPGCPTGPRRRTRGARAGSREPRTGRICPPRCSCGRAPAAGGP